MVDIHKNIEEYNANKKCKIIIVFDDMIADMLSDKNRNPIISELFIRKEIKQFSCFYHTLFQKILD